MVCRVTGVAIALVCLGFGAGPAAAFGNSIEKTAMSGQQIFIYSGATLNPDCSKLGRDDIRAVSGPSHGKVSILDAKTFVHFPPNNVRAKCNARMVDGIKVLYRSKPGFKGYDRVVLSIHTYTGRALSPVFNIKVE